MTAGGLALHHVFTIGEIKKKKRERAKDYQIQANKAQRDKIRSLYHLCDMLPFAETMSVSGREMKYT